jgi:Flp pilus assembly protein TadG
MKKKLRRETGGAAVEFAIILPLLILILFGTVEFGLLLYNKQVLTNASREGARAGIVIEVPKKDKAAIRKIIKDYCNDPDLDGDTTDKRLINFNGASDILNDSNITITGEQQTFGNDLIVKVDYTYNFLVLTVVRNFGFGLFDPLTLTATTTMKHE